MAMWLFRRKSRRKGPLATSSGDEAGERGRDTRAAPPRRHQTQPAQSQFDGTQSRPQQLKTHRTESNKLQRRPRAYSFSPNRRDTIRVVEPANQSKERQQPAIQTSKRDARGQAVASNWKATGNGRRVDSGVAALGEDVFPRAPTLHNKRGRDNATSRRKSSKRRRKNDQAREAEIKAMSQFVPMRPAADEGAFGRPMKKESRKARAGLTLPMRKPDSDKESRSSDISLPLAESIHSTLSSDSEHAAYKVSALEALAPRPKLLCDFQTRSGSPLPATNLAHRRKLSERNPYTDATIRAHKRIDDLANDLSASDLRELMERDKRRRERKRQSDQEKMERRLARRAEKQRSDEELAADKGEEPPKNLERGVMGRELVGLGIDGTSAVVTSSKRRSIDMSSKRQSGAASEKDHAEGQEESTRPQPLDSFHRMSSIAGQRPKLSHEDKELPSLPKPTAGEGLPPKKSRHLSLTAPGGDKRPDERARKTPESGSSRGAASWTAIFRWGTKNRRHSAGPSSFSNTSRDSMPAPPQPLVPVTFVPPRKPSTGVPKRTMSRFREDLPELPPHQPESQQRWSQGEPIPPTITEQSPELDVNSQGENTAHLSSPPTANVIRYDTPTSLDRSMEGIQQSPTSWSRREDMDRSPAPHSMSLASIDSEASWLSGRVGGRRRSSGMPDNLYRIDDQQARAHAGSDGTMESVQGGDEEGIQGDDHSVADDEYLSRFARQSGGETKWKRMSTGEARPSSDEDEEARWGVVKEKLPTMVHGRSSDHTKSREGLLNSFVEDDSSEGEDIHDDEKEDLAVQRATSINLGKGHVRHISAGSAKLLELSPRTSVDAKRASMGY